MKDKENSAKILIEEQIDGKIVVEDGFSFITKLRAEAKRQKDIKEANMTFASVQIEDVPLQVSSAEIGRLADEMEITEDDD
jgi:hypothetical protein